MNSEAGQTHRLQRWVHRSLVAGLLASALLLAGGLLVTTMDRQPDEGETPQSLAVLVHSAARGEGAALMTLGILALMATPILRVGVLAAGWSLEGERRFAAIAGAVLILLGVSLYLGLG